MIIINYSDKLFTLYVLKFPDGKVYVGITSQSLKERWAGGRGYRNQPVGKIIEIYGWENIDKEIIAENLDIKEAQEKERQYIDKYQKTNGVYNVTNGGECGSLLTSEFELNGIIYSSRDIAEMSSDGITYHDITTRVNSRGWDLEIAMSQKKMDKNLYVDYNGERYSFPELLQFSKVEGLKVEDLYARINRRGWDVERALTQPKNVKLQPHGVGERKYFYDGRWCNSYDLYLIRKHPDIKQSDIVFRIEQSKWSIEDAISIPPKI